MNLEKKMSLKHDVYVRIQTKLDFTEKNLKFNFFVFKNFIVLLQNI